MSKINRLVDGLIDGLAWMAGVFIVITWLSVNYEVFMRYIFNRPTSWVNDFSLYFIVYFTMLPAAWVLKENAHVRVEILVTLLPEKAQRILAVITSVIGGLICAVFFWYSLKLSLAAFYTKAIFARAVIVPRWPVYAVIPFGFLLLTFQFLRDACNFLPRQRFLRNNG